MAAHTVNGASPFIHRTLSTTVADTVTVAGLGVRAVKVSNRHATFPLYAKAIPTSSSSPIVEGSDGAVYIAPGRSERVWFSLDNLGQAYVSIVGNGNTYAVEAIGQATGLGGSSSGASTSVSTIDDLDDVAVSSPEAGDVMMWDGTQWVPSSSYATLAQVSQAIQDAVTPLIAGYNIQFSGATLSAAPLYAEVTSNITALVNNSTTLVDIPGMSIPLEANAKYVMSGVLIYSAEAAVADFKLGWSTPAGTTGTWSALAMHAGATVNSNAGAKWQTQNDYTETDILGGAGTGITTEANRSAAYFFGKVITSGTAGNLVARGAQGALHASDASVGIGTYMFLFRVG